MFPDLTPAVVRALEVARQLAGQRGASEVQPIHLLLALLEEEEGRAATLLGRAGLVPGSFKDARETINREAAPGTAGVSPPLAPETQQILADAREVAGDLSNEGMIAGDHLVVALLRRDEPLRHDLETCGLDTARLEAEVTSASSAPLRLDEPLQLLEPTEQVDAARILDAAANRAREALRVLEDYCRFGLDDRLLSGELKQLRHDLAETLAGLPVNTLLEARETQRDVGTSLTTAREQQRQSLTEVVQANLKRLQEALRSLEEYGKLHGPRLGQALKRLRYRSYTLERVLLLGVTARQRLANARLYVLVTGARCAAALDWTIQEVATGGARIIQLREKGLPDRELLERARKVRQWTAKSDVLFILNDRPDIARLAEADGVHLGQDDLPVKEARRIIGPDALIGVSTHSLEQAQQAVRDGASYLGVGPTFPSGTKHFEEFPGLELVRQVTTETSLPAFVLGGMNLQTLPEAVAAGAQRVAVSQAICQAEDPRAVAAAMLQLLTTPEGKVPPARRV
jgi:thiamine-phosphate pyrophosphorylase